MGLNNEEEMKKIAAKKQKKVEIGKIALSDQQDLVASLIDDEKLDLRIFVNSDSYNGPTKRGVRFYLFDGNWEEFKKLVEKIDRTYEAL